MFLQECVVVLMKHRYHIDQRHFQDKVAPHGSAHNYFFFFFKIITFSISKKEKINEIKMTILFYAIRKKSKR